MGYEVTLRSVTRYSGSVFGEAAWKVKLRFSVAELRMNKDDKYSFRFFSCGVLNFLLNLLWETGCEDCDGGEVFAWLCKCRGKGVQIGFTRLVIVEKPSRRILCSGLFFCMWERRCFRRRRVAGMPLWSPRTLPAAIVTRRREGEREGYNGSLPCQTHSLSFSLLSFTSMLFPTLLYVFVLGLASREIF